MLVAGVRPSQIAAIVGNPAERVPAAIMSTARAGKACLLVPRRAAQRSRDAKMAAGLSRWESERWKATCQGTLHFSSVRLVVPSEILTLDDVLMYAGRFYSTTTGNTETAAGYIAAETGLDAVRSCSARTVEVEWLVSAPACIRGLCSQVDIGDVSGDDIAACDSLIIGAPTWHTGADSERSGTVPRGLRVGVLPFAVPWIGLGGGAIGGTTWYGLGNGCKYRRRFTEVAPSSHHGRRKAQREGSDCIIFLDQGS